ncbi:high mobility group protein dsp1 [Holotrichia oblita]|uniref:High mobility group protein dsp1 n=1 Tax=Holotrichia oblita TaxID=644536 RepID=A0ACB9T7A7_HOLOL|nr:high mobility group protein dsp1 [Holotrichia oblita]
MSEHNRGAWGVREDGMWWPGAITADQQQSLQQHQQILHQQQQLAAQQLQSSTSSAPTQQQIFSYKMASSFQNPSTNVSSTSPIGAAGIRGYDYRLGGGMGGNPAMSGPTPASQWWYPSAMDSSMQNSLQNNIPQNNMQNMPPVHTPPPVSQAQLNQQVDAQRQQQQSVEAQRQAVEAHRQQAEVQRQQEAHRQQAEAHRQQEAHRQHQEAQRQYQEAQAHLHQQVVEAQARQAQLQQEHQQIQSQQVQNQQVNQSHHQNNSAQPILNLQAPPAPQKGRMPRGKADARPRGRMTAYAFFVQTCREEHKKKHPEENVVFAEFSKKCAERWKTMLDKEKKRFHEMAEKDKKRYDAEMQNYTPPKGEKQRGKKRKQIKDPNAPKRSLSAFFWFCNDERGKVKGANPEYGVGDIAKELGRRWAEADQETKAKYEAMAEKDKARYEKEMTAYKMKNNPNVQAPVPDPEEEEEDEEEAEDDEDD